MANWDWEHLLRDLKAKAADACPQQLKLLAANWYLALRPILFALPPEFAHAMTLLILGSGLLPVAPLPEQRPGPVSAFGLTFGHPLGLAAGFDKNGVVIEELFALGFSFVEIGGVTPQPQKGNPAPRLFRAPEQRALINRLGLNNEGVEAVCANIKRWRDKGDQAGKILGVNIAPNKGSESFVADYRNCLRHLAKIADYITINISSPNTPGLRELQSKAALSDLLRRLLDTRAKENSSVPLIVKIAPDLDDEALADIVSVVLAEKMDGLAVGNTTISRPSGLPAAFAAQDGGLSGAPLFPLATEMLGKTASLVNRRIPLIGIGGIMDAEGARAKLAAGAALVQLYSGLVFKGPKLVPEILAGLADTKGGA